MRHINQGESVFRRDVERHALEVNNAISDCITRLDNAIRSITIESPGSDEHIVLFYTTDDLALTGVRSVLDATPPASVSWTLRYGSDITGTGTEVRTDGVTTTSCTTGDETLDLTESVIPADVYVWMETTAASGTIQSLTISLLVGG